MKNNEILCAPDSLLTGLDQQKKFVLRMHLFKCECPNCKTPQNVYEATGVAIDDYDLTKAGPEIGTCIKCQRGLRLVVPLFAPATQGGWLWDLIPEAVG